ncbi:MAG: hypothetical protein DRG24_00480 [Epsilonproteobacteria bacterium]|nr:MAG: hypothetical protein DRG24_00480 [Campylobacterota bacterium]
MIYNKVFTTTINIIPNPIIVTNGNKIIIANDNFLSFFNYKSLEEFVKYNSNICNLFVQHKDYFSLDVINDDILWTDYIYENENPTLVSILDKDGKPIVFKISINKLQEYENYYVVVFTDITAIQNEKKLLEQLAYTDPLTNIYNRQMFSKLYLKEIENKTRHGDALSLIMFDIDHFKAVNDTYGHDVGDKVLITLTKLITKHLRTNDVFARWGGEEFVILLPRTNVDVAYNKAQELRQLIEQYHDDTIPSITVSLGITEVLDTDKEQSCFKRVDKALYQAKVKRNDVVQL